MSRLIRIPGMFFLVLAAAAVVFPEIAQAHPGHGGQDAAGNSLLPGFLHPFSGWDHMLAMLAVGLWAAQIGGRAVWLVPLSFVSLMVCGAVLGIEGIALPFVEAGIAASVVILGLVIALALRLPVPLAAAGVGLFAIFHGHAHGSELVAGSSALAYGAGFVVATALLHVIGICLGLAAKRALSPTAVRVAGGAITAGGILLCIGV